MERQWSGMAMPTGKLSIKANVWAKTWRLGRFVAVVCKISIGKYQHWNLEVRRYAS